MARGSGRLKLYWKYVNGMRQTQLAFRVMPGRESLKAARKEVGARIELVKKAEKAFYQAKRRKAPLNVQEPLAQTYAAEMNALRLISGYNPNIEVRRRATTEGIDLGLES